ncbi:hypothetical protein BOH78_4633 [Pichia kudriavzevii]|uniref:Uncharacterized protein n=1 Tax=Pichia kudriavzevii TaxID=4909 RepID=A0A1V2LEG5_PICKU|nr:hypothetical protein BOH78_5372 [Pichia kudriavzevii]ONH71298.1 hypothetical protein BOH78_4633 [Pichia kudriavzevii]
MSRSPSNELEDCLVSTSSHLGFCIRLIIIVPGEEALFRKVVAQLDVEVDLLISLNTIEAK